MWGGVVVVDVEGEEGGGGGLRAGGLRTGGMVDGGRRRSRSFRTRRLWRGGLRSRVVGRRRLVCARGGPLWAGGGG